MDSCLRLVSAEDGKRAFILRNGKILLKKFITSFNGKDNPIRVFSAKELKKATNNYDTREIITYQVWYRLYKGVLEDHKFSVMKYENFFTAYDCSFNNIVFASNMLHKNILKLIGYCLETETPILVFEYAEYGNLAHRINGRCVQAHFTPLLLKHRLKIAMEIANAVAYLHIGFSRPIVFRLFEPSNILFDEHYVAKLFDFSESRAIPEGETHINDSKPISMAHFLPEYGAASRFNEKYDIFQFGALLFALLTGQEIIDSSRDEVFLVDYVKKYIKNNMMNDMIDPMIVRDRSYPRRQQQLQAFLELAIKCISNSAEDRPTMIDIAKQLKHIYQSV